MPDDEVNAGDRNRRTDPVQAADPLAAERRRRDGDDDGGRADDEGGVESSGRGKQTLKRAGIAGAGGAIIGAIAGGGKGAGIGLLIGGAAGAGSVALKGSKELKLESGTELLVRVTQ